MKFIDKNIVKICLTGGPCAGKTTALAKIMETFAPTHTVYTIPELATITFSSGVTIVPSAFTEEDSLNFTMAIIQAQIDMEKYFENLALTQRKKALIISDRGCCDNFAYTSEKNKHAIIDQKGWNMNFLCNSRYDAVIHMVTAASGASDFYSLENNGARYETKDQAIEVDQKIQKEWMGHPNFVIIDNKKKGFASKIDRIINVVADMIGVRQKSKFVNKYLVDPSFNLDMIPSDIKYDRFYEIQTFLLTNKPKTQNYVFKRTYNKDLFPIYVYISRTIEDKYENRIETHRNIPERFYLDCVSSQKDPKYDTTKKSIVFFTHKMDDEYNMYFLEKITSRDQTFLVLKIIRDSEHHSKEIIPSWIKVIQEVTEIPRFFSMNFSNYDYQEKEDLDFLKYRRLSGELF